MHLAYAWYLVMRKLPLIVLLGLLGGAAGLGLATLTGSWTSVTYVSVRPVSANEGVRAVDPQRFFETQTQTILSDEVMGEAVAQLNDGTTPSQLRSAITLSGGASSDVLGVTVKGRTQHEALERQRAVSTVLTGHRFTGVVLTPLWATPLSGPPRTKLTAAGLVAGAAAGVLLVLLWGAARRPVGAPGHLRLGHDVRLYPVALDVTKPAQVRQFRQWLGTDAGRVVAVSARRGVPDLAHALASGSATLTDQLPDPAQPVVLVAGRGSTERDIEQQAALSGQGRPVVVIASPTPRSRRKERS